MKKLKFIKPMLAATLAAAPTLSLLTSCSQVNYSEIASAIKDQLIRNFTDLSAKTHRETFDCQQIFNYIKKTMCGILGVEVPTGFDTWAKLPCVEAQSKIDIYNPTGGLGERHFEDPTTHDFNYGNLWFDIPPSPGYEDRPGIIVHAHMDMTMDWKDDSAYERWLNADGDEDPVVIVSAIDPDEPSIKSDGSTSLGADNGIGVALMMALATRRNDFQHGPIRLLFSADESGSVPYKFKNNDSVIEDRILASGMDLLTFDQLNNGVFTYYDENEETNKSVVVFNSTNYTKPFDYKDPKTGETKEFFFKNIFSLDGSEQNTIYKSAAGIHQCQLLKHIELDETSTPVAERTGLGFIEVNKKEDWDNNLRLCTLTVEGLIGGHSAYNVSEKLGNALQLLMRVLSTRDPNFGLVTVSSSANAFNIAQSAYATFVISKEGAEVLGSRISTFKDMFKSMYPFEENLDVKLDTKEKPEDSKFPYHYLEDKISNQICSFSNTLEYGPMTYFETGEVKSSLNFGPLAINFVSDGTPYFDFSFDIVSRSADKQELDIFQDEIHNAVENILEFIDSDSAELTHIEDVVWEWKPEEKHPLLDVAVAGYGNIGVKPKQANSHAWLEVACLPPIFEKAEPQQDEPDMVVSGPYITNGHTVQEECWSDTIDPVIKSLLYTVQFYRG